MPQRFIAYTVTVAAWLVVSHGVEVFSGFVAAAADETVASSGQPAATVPSNAKALLLYQQGLEANAQGRTEAALQLFEQAALVEPTYANTFFNMGLLQYRKQNYQKAQQAFARAADLTPNDSEAWYNLGLAYEKLNNSSQAQASWQRIAPGSLRYANAQEKLAELTRKPVTTATASKPVSNNTSSSATSAAKPTTTTAATTAPAATKPAVATAPKPPVKAPVVELVAKDFSGPTGIAITADGTLLVANYSKNAIEKITPTGQKSLWVKDGGLNGPVGLVFDPRSKSVFVANYLGNSITRVDVTTGKMAPLVSNLKKPYYLKLDTNSNILYVTEQETNSMSRIRLPQ
ncbi:MAG: tetratricopeptide repeat protein [Vampirovibrionales bacterium]